MVQHACTATTTTTTTTITTTTTTTTSRSIVGGGLGGGRPPRHRTRQGVRLVRGAVSCGARERGERAAARPRTADNVGIGTIDQATNPWHDTGPDGVA